MPAYRSKWDSLPHHLTNLIIEKLEDSFSPFGDTSGALKAFLLLRSVSKSWNAAIAQYDGKMSVKAHRASDLLRLIHLLPYISKLSISGSSSPYQQFLAALPQPLTLSQAQAGKDESLLDVSPLPESLVGLRLSHCQVNPASFEHLRSLSLTALDLQYIQNTPAEVHQLLHCLPQLQVIAQTQAEERLNSIYKDETPELFSKRPFDDPFISFNLFAGARDHSTEIPQIPLQTP